MRTPPLSALRLFLGASLLAAGLAPSRAATDPVSYMGSGNVWTTDTWPQPWDAKLEALAAAGVKYARVRVNSNKYADASGNPIFDPDVDALLTYARGKGIFCLLILAYDPATASNPIDFYDWTAIGTAYANRYKPGGTFWPANDGYGVKAFAAFNEPDGWAAGPNWTPQKYADALGALGAAIHASSATLKFAPGGFLEPDKSSDFTLNGLGPLLAPHWNSGKLNALDLHIYARPDGTPSAIPGRQVQESGQTNFDRVKATNGITAAIEFNCTEFNVRPNPNQGDVYSFASESAYAKRVWTAAWDKLGVRKADGSLASSIAFLFILFGDHRDIGSGPGADVGNPNDTQIYTASTAIIDANDEPLWAPHARGKAFSLIADLTRGKRFTSIDPRRYASYDASGNPIGSQTGTGTYELLGGGQKLWVWQNVNTWTNATGTQFALTGIPNGCTQILVYRHGNSIGSPERTISIAAGTTSFTVGNGSGANAPLPTDETLAFLATGPRPIHHWQLNHDGRNSVGSYADYLGGKKEAVLSATGAVFGTTVKEGGGAVKFDGSSGWADIGASELSDTFTARTVSLWVKCTDNTPTANQVIYDEGGSVTGLAIRLTPAGQIQAGIRNNSGTIYTATATISDTNYHHIVVTFDGAGTHPLKIYKDKVLAQTTNTTYTSLLAHTQLANLGRCNTTDAFGTGTTGSYFNGWLDDVRVYSAALTQNQVNNLYDGY